MERNPFLISLDKDNDEAGVRTRLASHHGYNESYKPLVREWLRERDEARALEAEAIRNEREIETLNTAKEANRIARTASRWAMWATIIAVIAIITQIKEQIIGLIRWTLS